MVKAVWRARWFRPLLAVLLALSLCLAPVGDAWAARSGGRVGGGSFRAPSSYRAPSSNRAPVYGGGYGGAYGGGYGGGFGFPLLLPLFWGGGGGGFLTILLVLGAGSFLVRSLRERGGLGGGELGETSPVQVAEVKVAMLASARTLQREIDAIALAANTDTPQGLSRLLQDVTLSLVRHSEYWMYGETTGQTLKLNQAEQYFYQRSLHERSKFGTETLTRIGANPVQAAATLVKQDPQAPADPGEYVVVTLLVAHRSNSATLPVVDSAATLRRCVMQMGSVPADQVVAVEVLWSPQAEGDTLSSDELLTEYPQMRRL